MKYETVERRIMSHSARRNILLSIAQQSWDAVIQAETVSEKVEELHSTVNKIVETACPMRKIKIRADRPPWVTPLITKLIRVRNRVFKIGCKSCKVLRRLVQFHIRKQKKSNVEHQLNQAQTSKRRSYKTLQIHLM